jgi:ABC-type nitrate/sulfonate/bicarbonate transport system substrate-binding protein
MNQNVWNKLFGKVVVLNFVLSLVAVTNVAGQEKVKFPVSASSKTLGYSPLWVAHRQGFFDQQGLDVQLVLVSGADKSTMALMGGRCSHRAAPSMPLSAPPSRARGFGFVGRSDQRPDTRASGCAGSMTIKEPAIEFLAKEMKLKPKHARRGEYYTENRIWNPTAEANLEGVKAVIQIMAERGQLKPPLPSPAKYIGHSYVEEALKELGGR